MQWSAGDVSAVTAECEIEVSRETKALFKQFKLAAVADQREYTLPEGILGIIRVTYKGKKVWAQQTSDAHEARTYPLPTDGAGTSVHCYYFDPSDYTKFYIDPPFLESVSDSGAINYATDFIVSAYVEAVPSTFPLPAHLLKICETPYIYHKLFKREGKTQLLKASQFCQNLYRQMLFLMQKVASKPRLKVFDPVLPQAPQGRLVNRPILPSNFGAKRWK